MYIRKTTKKYKDKTYDNYLCPVLHYTSWGTIREKLSTHQAVTIVLPTDTGKVLRIRKGSTPEKEHREIYDLLDMPHEIMKPKKW